MDTRTLTYIYKNAKTYHTWTTTPSQFINAAAYMFYLGSGGKLNDTVVTSVSGKAAIRPVISLKSTVTAAGSGTASDPYVITGY